MKMKSLLWILLGSTAIYGAVLSSANAQNSPMPNQQNNKKIECEERNGTYYTMLNREEGSYRIIKWGEKRIGTDSYVLPRIRYDDLEGQDWTRVPYPVISPETRCQIVSQRLNSIYTGYSNRELILYTTRVPVTVNVDGSPVGRNWSYQSTVRPFVVCVDGLDCNNRGMVFTITTNYEDEAETILNKFVEVLQNPERDEPITLGSI